MAITKLTKALRRSAAGLALAEQEIGDLRAAAERKQRKREKVVGETGLFLNVEAGRNWLMNWTKSSG